LVAVKGEALVADGDIEMLGELVTVFDAAEGAADLVLALGAAAVGDFVGQLGKGGFAGAQQILALADPFLGQ